MGKTEEKKKIKKQRLFETALELFLIKGINKTTVDEIVKKAKVAKGTFYLYFKDKYDLKEKIVAEQAYKIFEDAINLSRNQEFDNFIDQFIFIVDVIIDYLVENPMLLKFIYKNLSIGLYEKTISTSLEETYSSILNMFINKAKESGINLKNPEITFFTIVEMISSTCYTSILYNKPVPIEEYKPFLYEYIKKLLKE
ncbi:TetR/AcrR family transcriptional regulator [Defluviitalea phaphyphila]|uniref:TetR/AcrR family transcriptional regulator n=1 Tax=Defluviitalea phaphyphila TaxID=1473580 RepID=UPI00073154EF|nr:TetR/AcrR family transcriptional regulator [Defluviitalea phaphyphila]